MGKYRHRLSFSAEHDSADLGVLAAKLGLKADRLWRAGEPRIAPNGRVIGGNHKRSSFGVNLSEGDDLPQSLREAVDRLMLHKALMEEYAASGAKFHFFIGWFSDDLNSGERLDWDLLRDIAALRVALDFDFYSADDIERAGS